MFNEFKPISKSEWLTKVEKDLKGKKSIDSFNWEIEGMTFSPFHHKDDGNSAVPLINGEKDNSWEIGERIVVKDYKKANQQALDALAKGANALLFVLSENPNQEALAFLLKDIRLEWISIDFDFVDARHDNVANLVNGLVVRKTLHGNISTLIKKGNDQLIQMHESGIDISENHHHIQFSIEITDDYFVSIAKIRALKILWSQILKEWGIEDTLQCKISAHIIPNTKDENYNKIKATTQAMSAVIGGANRLYIYPSDYQNNSNGTTFSRRIALNVQHLMQQESYLNRVVDPAAGSYYIEELTNRIAEKAWLEFVETWH